MAKKTGTVPMTDEQYQKVALMLKAIAHPLRLKILNVLADGERNVGDIVEATGAKSAVTSQQLGLMRDRGVLRRRREGVHVYYRIADENILNVVGCIRRSCGAE